MEQKKIITIIKRISKQNLSNGRFILCEPFVCLTNSFYFVQPGEDADFFFHSVEHMISKSYTLGGLEYKIQKGQVPFAEVLQSIASRLSVSVIQDAFDEKYFASQLERLSIEDKDDKELLREYLTLLDMKQLKAFLMLTKEGEGMYTMSQKRYDAMRRRFNKKARLADSTIPDMETALEDYLEYEKAQRYYYLEYLSKEEIVTALLKYIDKNLDVAVFAAKAIFYSDINVAYNCLNLLFYFQKYWGNNILHPLSLEEVKIEID